MRRWTLCIPTRDSARWIEVFLRAYRRLGVEPLYIVDSRSVDETLALLQRKGARTVVTTPRGDFVEAGMLEAACAAVDTEWVLRMDDDEFPSIALVNWIESKGAHSLRPGWKISRRDLFRRGRQVCYSRRPSAYPHIERPAYLSGQARLHRAKGLRFHEQVHSSGFADLDLFGFAPQEAFFVHCVDLLLSPAERLNKIRKYEAIEEGSAWRIADEYFPELFDSEHLRPSRDGLTEFASLIESLPRPEASSGLPITDRERVLAKIEVERWGREVEAAKAEGAHFSTSDWIELLKVVPRPFWRSLAKGFSTTGAALGSDSMTKFGRMIWNLTSYYASASL